MDHRGENRFGLDDGQQRREWLLQRWVRVLLMAALALIGAGLLGRGGPLSDRTVRAPDGAALLEYQRFVRHDTPDALHLTFTPAGATAAVRIDRAWLRAVESVQATPQPLRVEADGDAQRYVFATRPGQPVEVALRFEPTEVGALRGWVALEGGARLAFSQFAYP